MEVNCLGEGDTKQLDNPNKFKLTVPIKGEEDVQMICNEGICKFVEEEGHTVSEAYKTLNWVEIVQEGYAYCFNLATFQ